MAMLQLIYNCKVIILQKQLTLLTIKPGKFKNVLIIICIYQYQKYAQILGNGIHSVTEQDITSIVMKATSHFTEEATKYI